MLKVKIIVVERTRSPFLKEGETFYLKRLRKYAGVEWVEVRGASITRRKPAGEVFAVEERALTRELSPRDYVIAMDRTGVARDSKELASWLQERSLSRNRLAFVIGGPLGLSTQLMDRADEILSLSRLTLTHEMSRLLLLEQLYRACTIIRGEKYHK